MYVSALFSNGELLDKYDKKPPKTWDELMSLSEYIVEKENNTLLRYNGSFNGRNII